MNKPYYDPARLLRMYRYMQAYQARTHIGASIRELVDAGFASSTSVIRYYYVRMERLGMISLPSIDLHGRSFLPARSVCLLPLSEADPLIKNILELESPHENL